MTSVVTAAVEVRVDGQPLPDPDWIRSVRVASRLSQPSQCELVLALGHGEPRWPAQWRFGTRLTIQVTGEPHGLFGGEVTGIELAHQPDGTAELRVRAYDLLHRLRKRQRLRVFEDMTVAEVAAELTGDLGVDLDAGDAGLRLDRLLQHRQSDFELLVELAGQAGLYAVLRDRRLRLVTIAGYGDPVTLQLGTSLWDLRVEANLDRVVRKVTALGWHSQRAEALSAPAAAPRSLPHQIEPDRSLGSERFLVDRPVRSPTELAALAQADLDASVHRALTVTGIADGDARLWAGRRVVLAGVPAEAAGEHLLAEVVHTVTAAGYQTSFSSAVPPPPVPAGPATAGTTLTLGRVTDVSDPDGLGRVRVKLPALGDLDAGWLAMLCPGAGQGRGLVMMPDVGDTVLVGLPRHRPADGVVLGSLYGSIQPADPGVVSGAVRRWSMRTAAGHSIVVDDDARMVRVENGTGSLLELGPDRMRLHAATDLVIEAPGKEITIRARSVDFAHAPL